MKTQSATQFLSLRDRFLELLFNENVMDLILIVTQHFGGSCGFLSQDSLLLMETFHYIFMGQDPELIAKAYQRGSKVCPIYLFPAPFWLKMLFCVCTIPQWRVTSNICRKQ